MTSSGKAWLEMHVMSVSKHTGVLHYNGTRYRSMTVVFFSNQQSRVVVLENVYVQWLYYN